MGKSCLAKACETSGVAVGLAMKSEVGTIVLILGGDELDVSKAEIVVLILEGDGSEVSKGGTIVLILDGETAMQKRCQYYILTRRIQRLTKSTLQKRCERFNDSCVMVWECIAKVEASSALPMVETTLYCESKQLST